MRFLLPTTLPLLKDRRDPEREMIAGILWLSATMVEYQCYPIPPCFIPRFSLLVSSIILFHQLDICVNGRVPWPYYPARGLSRGPLAAYVRALGNEFLVSRGISGRRVLPAYAALAGRPGTHRLIHLQSQHSSSVVPWHNIHSIYPVLDILRLQRTTRNN